eukprot:GHVL01042790.1.p1 GENE.GHVL01042790.1~~GHVL01042790.1.p1  ORF type:complete len:701 (+),score=138.70 GHVL01042790.1:624-2726(+)
MELHDHSIHTLHSSDSELLDDPKFNVSSILKDLLFGVFFGGLVVMTLVHLVLHHYLLFGISISSIVLFVVYFWAKNRPSITPSIIFLHCWIFSVTLFVLLALASIPVTGIVSGSSITGENIRYICLIHLFFETAPLIWTTLCSIVIMYHMVYPNKYMDDESMVEEDSDEKKSELHITEKSCDIKQKSKSGESGNINDEENCSNTSLLEIHKKNCEIDIKKSIEDEKEKLCGLNKKLNISNECISPGIKSELMNDTDISKMVFDAFMTGAKSAKNTIKENIDISNNRSKEHIDYSREHIDQSSGHIDQSREHIDHSSGHIDHSSGHIDQSRGHIDHSRGHIDYSREQIDHSSGHIEQSRGHIDHSQGHIDYSSGHIDQLSGHIDQSRGHIDQSKDIYQSRGHIDHSRGHIDYSREHIDQSRGHIDHSREHIDQSSGHIGQIDQSREHIDESREYMNKQSINNSISESDGVVLQMESPSMLYDETDEVIIEVNNFDTCQSIEDSLPIQRRSSAFDENSIRFKEDIQICISNNIQNSIIPVDSIQESTSTTPDPIKDFYDINGSPPIRSTYNDKNRNIDYIQKDISKTDNIYRRPSIIKSSFDYLVSSVRSVWKDDIKSSSDVYKHELHENKGGLYGGKQSSSTIPEEQIPYGDPVDDWYMRDDEYEDTSSEIKKHSKIDNHNRTSSGSLQSFLIFTENSIKV